LDFSGGISGSNNPLINNLFNVLQTWKINTLGTKDANDHDIPIKVPVAAKMVTSMDGGGIDQVVHPQVTKCLSIGHSVDVLPSHWGQRGSYLAGTL
jgi:hypothetical protein